MDSRVCFNCKNLSYFNYHTTSGEIYPKFCKIELKLIGCGRLAIILILDTIHDSFIFLGILIMTKLKLILLTSVLTCLFSCTTDNPTASKKAQTGYLKDTISQSELNNINNFKRYYYSCNNLETSETSFLTSYFPLSKESRMKNNFGIYFQLDGGKAEPFDHIENKPINSKGTRFEVIYRSYHPIQGTYIDLIAREYSSTYYKNYNGTLIPWLECKES